MIQTDELRCHLQYTSPTLTYNNQGRQIWNCVTNKVIQWSNWKVTTDLRCDNIVLHCTSRHWTSCVLNNAAVIPLQHLPSLRTNLLSKLNNIQHQFWTTGRAQHALKGAEYGQLKINHKHWLMAKQGWRYNLWYRNSPLTSYPSLSVILPSLISTSCPRNPTFYGKLCAMFLP